MSDSEFTDEDELDEYPSTQPTPSQKRNGVVKKAQSGYMVKNALKPPRTTSYTARALFEQVHSGDINLEPEYQRGVVWADVKQIGLIDSIFRNFYVPPIIFAVNTHDDGSETKVCIDGKQRLTSIQRFMDGLIPHKDLTTGTKLWFKESAHKKAKDKILPERYAALFSNKQIVCVEYSDLTEENEREIFMRVQMGMALTPAEKMASINSEWSKLVRQIINDHISGEDDEGLDWDRSRGRDFQNVATCIFVMDKYPNIANVGTFGQVEKWLNEGRAVEPEFIDKVNDTFRIFLELIRAEKYSKVFKLKARIAPIEFIMITVLISVFKNRFSMMKLAHAIKGMRDKVREVHVDIRSNSKVAKTMMDFLNSISTKSGKITGEGEPAGKNLSFKRKSPEEDGQARIPPPATQMKRPKYEDTSHIPPEKPVTEVKVPFKAVDVPGPSSANRPPIPLTSNRMARLQELKAQANQSTSSVDPRRQLSMSQPISRPQPPPIDHYPTQLPPQPLRSASSNGHHPSMPGFNGHDILNNPNLPPRPSFPTPALLSQPNPSSHTSRPPPGIGTRTNLISIPPSAPRRWGGGGDPGTGGGAGVGSGPKSPLVAAPMNHGNMPPEHMQGQGRDGMLPPPPYRDRDRPVPGQDPVWPNSQSTSATGWGRQQTQNPYQHPR